MTAQQAAIDDLRREFPTAIINRDAAGGLKISCATCMSHHVFARMQQALAAGELASVRVAFDSISPQALQQLRSATAQGPGGKHAIERDLQARFKQPVDVQADSKGQQIVITCLQVVKYSVAQFVAQWLDPAVASCPLGSTLQPAASTHELQAILRLQV